MHVYPPAVELFSQGSIPGELYLVERGLIKLIRRFQDGREMIIDLRYPGQLTGAASILLQRSYPVTAITVGRCHLYRAPANIFIDLLRKTPDFCWQVLLALGRDIYEQYDHLAELGGCSARNRLEHLLWKLQPAESGEAGSASRLAIPLKHWEVAQLLAVTPAYLSRLLSQLERDGIIQRSKGWIITLNRDALWHLG